MTNDEIPNDERMTNHTTIRLGDLAGMVRSKNAGSFTLTFDIMARDDEAYRAILDSGRLNRDVIGQIYQVSPEQVDVFEIPSINAIKISIPRLVSAGSPRDLDVYGAQQAAPLIELPL